MGEPSGDSQRRLSTFIIDIDKNGKMPMQYSPESESPNLLLVCWSGGSLLSLARVAEAGANDAKHMNCNHLLIIFFLQMIGK